jgi:hypothetical protein
LLSSRSSRSYELDALQKRIDLRRVQLAQGAAVWQRNVLRAHDDDDDVNAAPGEQLSPARRAQLLDAVAKVAESEAQAVKQQPPI